MRGNNGCVQVKLEQRRATGKQGLGIPNLSFLVNLGVMRSVQARFERGSLHNPDAAAWRFLTLRQRAEVWWRGLLLRRRLRRNPFYCYVPGRTRHYDRQLQLALAQGCRAWLNLGCGTDTRVVRFAGQLTECAVAVYEFEQPKAAESRRQILGAAGLGQCTALDLNAEDLSLLASALANHANQPVFVMLEGVSPYIARARFVSLLQLFATHCAPGSCIAYDYKRNDRVPEFGRSLRAEDPFRLSALEEQARAWHQALGFDVEEFVASEDLCPPEFTRFDEDRLVRLRVR